MATLIVSDLEFILQQILVAEAHANGAELTDLLPNSLVPMGLRTVDGSYNNLVPGQQFFGAADQLFPRLLPPEFQDGDTFGSYGSDGTVVDSQPRTISNLIVDQTVNNPAALEAAIAQAGLTASQASVATADIEAVNDLKNAVQTMNTSIALFTAALTAPGATVTPALLERLASAQAAVTAAAAVATAAVTQLTASQGAADALTVAASTIATALTDIRRDSDRNRRFYSRYGGRFSRGPSGCRVGHDRACAKLGRCRADLQHSPQRHADRPWPRARRRDGFTQPTKHGPRRGSVGRLQLVVHAVRPVLRSRPGSRHQGGQRSCRSSVAARRSTVCGRQPHQLHAVDARYPTRRPRR